jgi:hypothetical protein
VSSIPSEVIGCFSFNLSKPSSRTMALGLNQPLTKMSTGRSFWNKTRPVRKADNLTADCLENMESSTSQNLTGLRDLLKG